MMARSTLLFALLLVVEACAFKYPINEDLQSYRWVNIDTYYFDRVFASNCPDDVLCYPRDFVDTIYSTSVCYLSIERYCEGGNISNFTVLPENFADYDSLKVLELYSDVIFPKKFVENSKLRHIECHGILSNKSLYRKITFNYLEGASFSVSKDGNLPAFIINSPRLICLTLNLSESGLPKHLYEQIVNLIERDSLKYLQVTVCNDKKDNSSLYEQRLQELMDKKFKEYFFMSNDCRPFSPQYDTNW